MAVATINASTNHDTIAVQFDKLAEILPEAGKNLRIATLCLRGSFSVAHSSIKEFTELRESIVNDANVYRHKVLPVAKQSTNHAKDFMDYFETLSAEHVLSIQGTLTNDANENQKLMTLCKDMHMAVSANFKNNQDKIDNVLNTCQLEKKHFESEAAKLRRNSDIKNAFAVGLLCLPVVSAIASPLLKMSADRDSARATANEEEAQLAVNATYVIKDCLVDAIMRYVSAMDTFAATFQLLASEIASFLANLEKFGDTEKNAFHLMCKAKAQKVASACDTYNTAAIAAETDLMSLPDSCDKNYVQKWLERFPKKRSAEGEHISFKDRLMQLGRGGVKILKDLGAE